jgi:transposase-like protein
MGSGPGATSGQSAAQRELRRRNRTLEQENEILLAAAVTVALGDAATAAKA